MKAAADALKSEHSNALQQAQAKHGDETKQARDALEAKHSNESGWVSVWRKAGERLGEH